MELFVFFIYEYKHNDLKLLWIESQFNSAWVWPPPSMHSLPFSFLLQILTMFSKDNMSIGHALWDHLIVFYFLSQLQ